MTDSSTAVARVRGALAGIVCLAVVLFTAARPSAQTSTAVPVQWTNLAKATANASSIQKTSGCAGCSDAGGTSAQVISTGTGYVEFTPILGARLFAGLGSTATSDTDPALINYAFSFWPDGGWDVRERNVYKTEGRFVAGDVFRVAVAGGAVKYYKNGALVYSSGVLSTGVLVLDTTLTGGGATLNAASIAADPAPPASTPVTIGTTTLPDGALTTAYSAALSATGGSATFNWTIAGGALPSGLGLAPAGTIAGVPSVPGAFTFTARATDAAQPSNFAERTLTIGVAAAAPVTIGTAAIPAARIGEAYSTPLQATGGTGGYIWSVVAGALPQGLSVNAGLIQGTTTSAGRFSVTVRAADNNNTANFAERTFALNVLAAAPPSVYDAVTDRTTRAKGPLPALGGAGYVFTDPDFGTRMMRVTDTTVRPGAPLRSFRTPSGVHSNAWSADARYFYTTSTDGTIIPFSFDRTTMRAQRLQPATTGDGGMTLQFFAEPMFSYLTPGIIYGTYNGAGSNLRSVDQYDFQTGQYSQLLNLDSVVGNLAGTYLGGLGASAGPVEKIMSFFGGTSQDRHFYVLVFDRANPSNRHLVDTQASTIDGQPTNIPLNFKVHGVAIDRSGEFVTIYPTGADLAAPRSAAQGYVWDTLTNTFAAMPLVEAISGGHDAYGYGYRVNQDCCTHSTYDAAQWQLRSLVNPLVTFDLNPNVLLPKEVYLADHPSWHNAQADRLVPFIDANYRYGDNTTPWRAWDEEIIAVQTEGAGTGGTIWRFAHHRSAVADDNDPTRISFWNTPRANVSPDGRWALFTSNWEKTLGTDPQGEAGGTHRQDVFLVELLKDSSAIVPPPAAPVVVTTTAAPAATTSSSYSLTLEATGGSGAYRWSIVSGALPAGLTLNPTSGVISGTSSFVGTQDFVACATDAAAATNAGTKALSITMFPTATTAPIRPAPTKVPGL
jgi:hypothetical protein